MYLIFTTCSNSSWAPRKLPVKLTASPYIRLNRTKQTGLKNTKKKTRERQKEKREEEEEEDLPVTKAKSSSRKVVLRVAHGRCADISLFSVTL